VVSKRNWRHYACRAADPQRVPSAGAPRTRSIWLLGKFHYLSTVSGGGYIGSWLTAWRRTEDDQSVFEKLVSMQTTGREPPQITGVRSDSNYITPILGLLSADTWTVLAIYVRNLLLNWLLFVPLFTGCLLFPFWYKSALAWAPRQRACTSRTGCRRMRAVDDQSELRGAADSIGTNGCRVAILGVGWRPSCCRHSLMFERHRRDSAASMHARLTGRSRAGTSAPSFMRWHGAGRGGEAGPEGTAARSGRWILAGAVVD
jgi:hypothetical protein